MESCRAGLKVVQPRRVQRAESYVMGIELCIASPEAVPALTEPKLWHQSAEALLLNIPDSVQPEVLYAVYTDYGSDQHEYSVIVAVEVSSIDNPPENMVGLSISAGEYLVFEAIGHPPDAVTQAWQQIEAYFTTGCRYQRAFTTDFELYNQQQVKIYIAIKSVIQSI